MPSPPETSSHCFPLVSKTTPGSFPLLLYHPSQYSYPVYLWKYTKTQLLTQFYCSHRIDPSVVLPCRPPLPSPPAAPLKHLLFFPIVISQRSTMEDDWGRRRWKTTEMTERWQMTEGDDDARWRWEMTMGDDGRWRRGLKDEIQGWKRMWIKFSWYKGHHFIKIDRKSSN